MFRGTARDGVQLTIFMCDVARYQGSKACGRSERGYQLDNARLVDQQTLTKYSIVFCRGTLYHFSRLSLSPSCFVFKCPLSACRHFDRRRDGPVGIFPRPSGLSLGASWASIPESGGALAHLDITYRDAFCPSNRFYL